MCWKKACILLLFFAVTAIVSPAQTVTTLAAFEQTNGATPRFGSVVQATNGDLYGTTEAGGSNNYGTIFEITPAGVLTTLHSFNLTDGANPTAALVQATNGDLYGTASLGGTGTACGRTGCGTIFKITVAGALTTLYNFDMTDGTAPGGLIQAANGDFYGTTTEGGAGTSTDCPGGGCGTIFKITPAGALTTVHNFNSIDGAVPGDLVQATNGDLYGTTMNGGAGTACENACGTIFKITPAGALTTLHSFDGHDGSLTNAGLVQATNGDLYGTTYAGGNLCAHDQTCGTIFKITLAGVFTTLYNFSGTDGAFPEDSLVQGTDGYLYGTTYEGGSEYYSGTIFRITPAGALTTLHSFSPYNAGGYAPAAGLTQDTNGDFYGTTMDGVSGLCQNGCGTVFELSVGLGPFLKTLPTVGVAGSAVRILGTDLSGATSVTFNGIAAAFSVVSATQILARVPADATTGKVQVITPGGTLLSNVGFVVP